MEPIDRATVWPYDEHGEPGEFVYQRYAHPTGAAAERALGRAGGRRRTALRVRDVGRHGVRLRVLPARHDGRARRGRLLRHRRDAGAVRAVGAERRRVRPVGPAAAGADVVWLEAPANPLLTLPDWEAVRAHPAFVVCDATISTPVFLHALDEGADVVLHSATKYLTGHSNAMLGATVTREPARTKALYDLRLRLGLAASPDAAAALLHGLETLELRVRRQTETARVLAGPARGAPGSAPRPLPGLRRPGRVRRRGRRRARGRDGDRADREPDVARRGQLVDGEPLALGGRPHPARPAAPLGRARGRRGRSGPTSPQRSTLGDGAVS